MNQVIQWIWERPARALKVYYSGSRSAAITEKCIECVGTSQEAGKCEITDCALWKFRPGAEKGVIPDFVPSKEELETLAEGKVSPKVREHAKRMGEARRKDLGE